MVESNGPGASKFKPGQRVVGFPWPLVDGLRGTYQQYVVVKEASLVGITCDPCPRTFLNSYRMATSSEGRTQ